ncbi:MAG: glycoside hydrolase family 27 protein [Bacteroidales bacterium]|nr:glycoside hydrolase family 27 protein [Bacteroidales bacterium]
MNIRKLLFSLLALPVCFGAFAQKYDNIAKTPQMGWNSWNKFNCNINEQLVRETADTMVELGLVDAGYIYLNMDDCWHGERDSLGFITENKEKFPSGLKSLSDYLHSKGLKFGIYSDAGRKTCAGFPGSFGHEYQDAIRYAQWGVDYLKYDWCAAKDINPKGAYALMRDALKSAGRPVLFSMCEWGSNQPWLWAENVGHSWRTTGDICASFAEDMVYDGWKALSVLSILDMQVELRQYAGPGHWNDPDMLEVGNGMSVSEDRAHFTMWCMLAAPLLLGNDLTNMTKETLEIITNREVIAIDQDTLGVQGLKFKDDGAVEYWFKPLAGGQWAFCILNRSNEEVTLSINWKEFNFTDELSGLSTAFDKVLYDYKDLWNSKNVGNTRSNISVTIGGHDVSVYRLTPNNSKKSKK